jgi:hypothetical protein
MTQDEELVIRATNTIVERAPYSGILELGNLKIACAVLEDGTRVLSEREVTKALGGKRGGAHWRRMREDGIGANLPLYLSAKNLAEHVDDDLASKLKQYRLFRGKTGSRANGIDAVLLPRICNVYLEVRDAGKLHPSQIDIAKTADVLMRTLAQVGIVALVDEATGHQEIRAKDALAQILRRFIAEELSRWAKTFPDAYYKELFRLRGLTYSEFTSKRPMYMGKITKDIVYSRLAPNVLEALEKKNPRLDSGRRKNKHHQWLTQDEGMQRLREHLAAIIVLMKVSSTWSQFESGLERALPKPSDQLTLLPYDDYGSGAED